MVFLAAALVAVAALCTLDLALTLAVLRRLRDRPGDPTPTGEALTIGARVADFSTHCHEGIALTPTDLTDDAIVAFFSPGCPPCRRELPTFIQYATGACTHRQIIAVIVTPGDDDHERAEAQAMAARLAPVARVIHEDLDGPCTNAFAVSAFPAQFAISAPGGTWPTIAAVGHAALTTTPVGSA